MEHLELHPHAYLNDESIVVSVVLFESHDASLIHEIKTSLQASSVKSCCEYGECGVGSYFYNGAFYPPKPHASWVVDESTKSWKAPIDYPEDGKTYSWNEETVSWESFIPDAPFESWTWDADTWGWLPPVPSPNDGKMYSWNELEQKWEETE